MFLVKRMESIPLFGLKECCSVVIQMPFNGAEWI